MRYPTKDCECEDFPLCEHADNFPEDDVPEYCDICGYNHRSNIDCFYRDDDEDEDA